MEGFREWGFRHTGGEPTGVDRRHKKTQLLKRQLLILG
jgi:hypothetical protein